MPSDIQQASPPTLNHLVGQRAVVNQVKVALDAAFADSARVCHMLLTGAPGLGKTLLAQIVAKEMASEFHEVLGQSLAQPSDLFGLLLQATDKSVVFVDESDELPTPIQTVLYRAVEERKLFLPQSSSGRGAKSIPLADFTLLLASNHEHSLVQPLRDRMKLILRFEQYSETELHQLVQQRARALHWEGDTDVFPLIAARGRGTPRLALRLLEACRRTCRSESETAISKRHFYRTCELEGIDALGLDRYLPFDTARPLRLPPLRDTLAERILDESQVQRMLAMERHPRNSIMLTLLYATGVRVSELCGLKWGDCCARNDGGQVSVFGKGSKTRAILIPASVWHRLAALRGEDGADAPVFLSRKGGGLCPTQVLRIVKKAAARAGIAANVVVHTFRHCHASHSLERGASVALVGRTLGHSPSSNATGRYLHARPDDSSSRYLPL